MAFDVGSVIAHITADTAGFKSGITSAQGMVNKFKGGLSSFNNELQGFMTKAAVVGAATSAALGLIAKTAIDSASDFEQARISFEVMLGSADTAQKLLREISDFAMKTPFELPQLVEGSKKLLAYGIEAEKLIPTLGMLGDLTAALGTEKMPQLILAYGQVKAATRLTGMELRQFTEAGVPMLEALSKQMGKTVAEIKDMISNGEVSFDDVQKALASMTGEGGKFFKLMERQSKTFGGVMSNIRDQFGRLLRTFVGVDEAGNIAENSIFARLKQAAEGLLNFLMYATPTITAFVGMLLDKVNAFFSSQLFADFLAQLQALGAWIMANQDLVLSFIKGLGIALGTLLILGTISSLIAALTNPLTLVVAAITLLYMAWVNNWGGIQEKTKAVVEYLRKLFEAHREELTAIWNAIINIVKIVAAIILKIWETYGQSIVNTVQGAFNIIAGFIRIILATISGIINAFVALVKGDWVGFWDALRVMAKTNLDAVQQIFSGAVQAIIGIIQSLFPKFKETFEKVLNYAKDISKKIRESISSAFDVNKRNSPSIMDRLNQIVSSASSALGSITVPNYSHDISQALQGSVAMGSAGMAGGITINLAGAYISDEIGARKMAEIVGDNIIKKLHQNVRF